MSFKKSDVVRLIHSNKWSRLDNLFVGQTYLVSEVDEDLIRVGIGKYWIPTKNFILANAAPKPSKIRADTKRRLKQVFRPGDKVYLIPDSMDEFIESENFVSMEELVTDYEYEVERFQAGYWKQEDEDTLAGDIVLNFVNLVHTRICGGSGFPILTYRLMSRDEYYSSYKKI